MAPDLIKNEKGSVLVHVLITGMVVAILAAGLMNAVMLQYTTTYRAEQSSKGKRQDEEALSLLIADWNQNQGGLPCPAALSHGYGCVGAGVGLATPINACSCVCSAAGMPTIRVGPWVGAPYNVCTLNIDSGALPLP